VDAVRTAPARRRAAKPCVDAARPAPGRLITVEGIDGAGKSTQVERLAALLAGRGHRLVGTREPGATALGHELRRVVLGREIGLSPDAELLLFLADRAEHVATVIKPALEAGALVLCDRFADSTLAYQGYGRGRDLARVRRWNADASAGVEPDLTLLLDCPIELGAGRRHRQTDRYHVLDRDFHERVRQGFLAEAAAAPTRIRVIDASRDLDAVTAEVAGVTLEWLAARGVGASASR
jgi:dTMP kinase